MLSLRKILFYCFIAVYLFFCPVLILYALGYIFSPVEGQGIVKSGLVYLSTTPPGATVYLGNRKYTNKTPAAIQNLIPGDYPVRISLKKHQSWSEIIPVEAGKATVLERILLLPDQFKTQVFVPNETFQELTPVPGTRYFLLSKGQTAQDLYLYDSKSEDLRAIFPPYVFPDSSQLGFYFEDKSPDFVVSLSSEQGERFLWVSPRRREIRTKDITSLLSGKPEHIHWEAKDRNFLLVFQDGYLDLIDVVNKASQNRFALNIRGFGLFENKICMLSQDFNLEWMSYQGEREKILFDNSVSGEKLFGNMFYQIKMFPGDVTVFLGDDGRLVTNRFPYRLVDEGVLGLQFDEKQKRLLIWTEEAIGMIDFSKSKSGRELSDSTAKLVWLYQKGRRIEQAFWLYDGSHVIFRDRSKIYLLELETYAKPHLHEVLEVKENSSIDYSEQTGYLHYLEPKKGQLYRLELVPRYEILPLPFPERKEEKKKLEFGTL